MQSWRADAIALAPARSAGWKRLGLAQGSRSPSSVAASLAAPAVLPNRPIVFADDCRRERAYVPASCCCQRSR